MLALIDQVSEGVVRGDAARSRIWECDELYTMSSEESTEIICRIHEVLSSKSENAVRLHVSLVERGDLMTWLEDAQKLSPSSRREKWESDATTKQREQALQLEHAAQIRKSSRLRSENKRANRDAWQALDLSSNGEARRVDLLAASEEELLLKSPVFWNNVPLEEMSEDLMRACMGRIDALLLKHGRGRFPESLSRRYDEHLTRLPAPECKGARVEEVAVEVVEVVPTVEEDASCAMCGCLSLVRRARKKA